MHVPGTTPVVQQQSALSQIMVRIISGLVIIFVCYVCSQMFGCDL